MKIYQFISKKHAKHIDRDEHVHEFVAKRDANDARKRLLKLGFICTEVELVKI